MSRRIIGASRDRIRVVAIFGLREVSHQIEIREGTGVEIQRLLSGLPGCVVTLVLFSATAANAQVVTPIHDVQGPGASSPIVGATVTIRGIVTGVTQTGFFVQAADADVDADPATSEGIFVFTSSSPTAVIFPRTSVEVTGTVAEVVPASDVLQPPSTQLISPTVTQLAAGQTLPTPIPLTSTFPDPNGPVDQLERLEHMRVTVASLTVTGPAEGTVNESEITLTSGNGLFYGVLTGVARPFREPGIQAPDPPPAGTIPPIPRWDANPERIGVASGGTTGGLPLSVKSGDVVGPLVGPLDYTSRTYTVLLDGTVTTTVTPGSLRTTVSTAAGNEITVASVHLRRFFDTTDVPSVPDVVLTTAAYAWRLVKTSIAIRDHLRNPDIIGVQEAETLGVLTDLAARIRADGGPTYVAFWSPGNDPAGLNVGFLYKTDPVAGGVARVSDTRGTQVGRLETWIDPATGAPALLNDRPPLVLEATVNRAPGASFPVVVIVSDLEGLNRIDSVDPIGLTTVGDRVRRKRQAQAEFLARHVQGRQAANPGEHLVLVGSHNAFEFNDGYVDVMNVIAGTPPPNNETAVPGDGVDLVNPDLLNLAATVAPAERYSDVFKGTARNLDHALVSAALVAATSARRIEHSRIAADYSEVDLGNVLTARRFSNRDPVVAYFATSALDLTDLAVTKVGTPNPVVAGQNLTYTITVTNNGPDAAASAALSDTLPPGMTFVSLTAPAGWSCSTPAVGAAGTVSCSIAAAGVGSALFTLVVAVAPTAAPGSVVSNTATVESATADAAPANNSATWSTIIAGADLSITMTGPATIRPGMPIAYTLTVANAGPSSAAAVTVDDQPPSGLTFARPRVQCITLFPCQLGTLAPGESRSITAIFSVPPGYAGPNPIVNVARVSASTADPAPANNSATASTLVTTTGPECDVNGDGRSVFITGAGAGGGPHVRLWSVEGGQVTEPFGQGFFAYHPAFTGGVQVACGDVTGDGVAELITGPGAGGGPHVRVWSIANGSLSELTGFFAYNPGFGGGVAVAAGDVTGDGVAELITGAGTGGGPHVRVWNVAGGVSELTGFLAYDPAFASGVAVAAGDLTGDGVSELITGAGPGGGPHVRVWSVAGGTVSELASFFAYDPAFTGGVAVAAGDLTGDGVAELVTSAALGGGPHVRVWSLTDAGPIEVAGFFPYDPAFAGGVAIAAGDVTGDGIAELITGPGPGGGPHVRVWSLTGAGLMEVAGFYAYNPAFPGGVFVGR